MTREYILNMTRAASETMTARSRSGTYQREGDEEPIECSVTTSIMSERGQTGGFVRIRTAAVWISKELHPEKPVDNERVTIVAHGREADTFRVQESHEQAANYWFIRLAQWGD